MRGQGVAQVGQVAQPRSESTPPIVSTAWIEDASVVKRYVDRPKTAYEHAWEIRDAYGYHAYEDHAWGRRLRGFLHGRAWTQAEGPVALFDQAVAWLRRDRVPLPGVSVLARQVAEVREVAEARLYATVAQAARCADPDLLADLVATLAVPEGRRFPELERLRRPPTRTTGPAMVRALERVDEISAFRLGRLGGIGQRARPKRRSAPGDVLPVPGLGPGEIGEHPIGHAVPRGQSTRPRLRRGRRLPTGGDQTHDRRRRIQPHRPPHGPPPVHEHRALAGSTRTFSGLKYV